MAKERKASVVYEGNNSQTVYAFPFDYLRKAFVKVQDIYTNITELVQGTDYTVSDKQITLTTAIPLSHSIKIYRETTTSPLVEWQDASVLRSADLTLQEVQLLHLAEETADKVFDSGMSTSYSNSNVWDGQYKRISNLLDPIEEGDAVTLRYINANQTSLLNQLKNTGAAQNTSIVATGDAQNTRLTNTGDTQNTRLTTTGDSYVSTMTTLKSDATNQAELAKKWAQSDSSPDGVSGNKSSKTWATEAKNSASAASTYASNAKTSETNAKTSETNAKTSETNANTYKNNAASSASAAASSASTAQSYMNTANTYKTNAASSASAAAASATSAANSATKAATFNPDTYMSKTDLANTYLKKTDASNTYATKTTIPTKTSQLTNDSNFVQFSDGKALEVGNYIDLHTSNDMTKDYTCRLLGNGTLSIQSGQYIQVMSNGHLSINGSEVWVE